MREKAKKLFDCLTNVQEEYIEEAQAPLEKAPRNPVWILRIVAAACACLVLTAGILFATAGSQNGFKAETAGGVQSFPSEALAAGEGAATGSTAEPGDSGEHRWPVKKGEVSSSAEYGGKLSGGSPAPVPGWDELEIYGQYPNIPYNGLRYWAGGGVVPEEDLESELGTIAAKSGGGYEGAEEDVERRLDARIWKIRGISQHCAVAVQYSGVSSWYSALNQDYVPETLGQFIDDLDLRENLVFGAAEYQYRSGGEIIQVQFDSVDSARVWELLLSDRGAPNVPGYFENHPAEEYVFDLRLAVSLPILGEENLGMTLWNNGYLETNLMSRTQKLFYIGEEAVEAFKDYVVNECEGYEIEPAFSPPAANRERSAEAASSSAESVPAAFPPERTVPSSTGME